MRTATQRKTETRERILEAAGRLFREHGVDGIGVDALMREAGLTHGGFYLHFPSKEALAAEVARSLLQTAAARWDEISRLPDGATALKRIVEPYLSPAHALSPAACPLTTLGPDVARRAESQAAIAESLHGMLDALVRLLGRPRAVAALSTMVGAVVLARLSSDHALSQEFLATASAEVLASNGLTSDGLASSGLASSGLASSGLASSGLASSGLASDGQASNGLASSGLASEIQASRPASASGVNETGTG